MTGDQDQGRSGPKDQPKSLSLSSRKRGASLERQANARDLQITEIRGSANVAASAEPESCSDVKLDPAFVSILKKKVHLLVDTENTLSRSLERIKHLEEQQQQRTVPKGLKIKSVKAKSKSEDLQKKFDDIIQEAELKLLDATLESLRREVHETESSITSSKDDLKTTIDRWRSSFPLKDEKSTSKADLLAERADKFVDDFYFHLTAHNTSKSLQESLTKEEKAKKRHVGMETEFAVTEESIRDIVKAEVQRLGSEQGAQNSRRGRSRRKDSTAGNVNKTPQKRGSSSKKRNPRKRSRSTGRRNQQRSQSSNNRRVSLPKNGRGKGAGHGT